MPWGLLTVALPVLVCMQGSAAQTAPATGSEAGQSSTHHATHHASTATKRSSASAASKHGSAHHATTTAKTHTSVRHVASRRRPRTARSIARSHKLQQAFVASTQLRPMAQQLATGRSPAAYEGVAAYARSHSGEAASAAYLALGHAYLLDHRYPDALENLAQARKAGDTLADYSDYLAAQADIGAAKLTDAEKLLTGFATRYPESIFVAGLPVTMANLKLVENDPQGAIAVLRAQSDGAIASHPDYLLALAKANQAAGNPAEAARIYRHIFLGFPLSPQQDQVKTQISLIETYVPMSAEERRAHADALYNGGRYAEAAEEYRALASEPASSTPAVHAALLTAAAACD